MQPAAGVTPAVGPAADVLGYNTGLVRRSTGTEVTEEQDHRVSAGSTPESRADNRPWPSWLGTRVLACWLLSLHPAIVGIWGDCADRNTAALCACRANSAK